MSGAVPPTPLFLQGMDRDSFAFFPRVICNNLKSMGTGFVGNDTLCGGV